MHYEVFNTYDEAFNTYGQYEREEDMIAISCCKSEHPKSRDRNCLQPSKPSIQNKLPHQLPLETRKITSETNNGVENATRACKSVS